MPNTGLLIPAAILSEPHLGCYVRRRHDFETDAASFNLHLEMPEGPHRVYFRACGGRAAFWQRCLINTSSAFLPVPQDVAWQLGGDAAPQSSPWFSFGPVLGPWIYWFFGQHHRDQEWYPDYAVGHIFDEYENGTLSHVWYEDTGADRDFDDFRIEVAVERLITSVEIGTRQLAVNRRLAEERLARLVKEHDSRSNQKR